jgi:uncharacterized membrane protein YkvI
VGTLPRGVFKVAVLYVGAVLGAGFSSGQEIMQFFGSFGTRGLWGVALATVLFAYLGAVIQVAAVRIGATSYREILVHLLGKKTALLVDYLSMGMLVVGLGIMLAGSGAIFQERLGLSSLTGVLFLAVLIGIIIWAGLTGVVVVNAILVPVKLILVMGVAVLALCTTQGPVPTGHGGMPAVGLLGGSWVWAAVLYVSYNMVVPLAVLSTLGRHLTPAQAVRGGLAGGVLLGLAAGLVTAAIVVHYAQVWPYQVPLLYLAAAVHPAVGTVSTVVIWLAVFTTGIANAHGFASRVALPGSSGYRAAGLAAIIIVIPVTFFDFATLVGFFYPLFGCLGLVLLAALLAKPLAGFCHTGRKL